MRTPGNRPRRRGFALILVTAHVILLISFWNIANRQTGHLLSLEDSLNRRDSRDRGGIAAAAVGAALLETGTPVVSPFTGRTTRNVDGTDIDYLVTFTDLGDGRWSIEVVRAPSYDQTEPLPSTFALGM